MGKLGLIVVACLTVFSFTIQMIGAARSSNCSHRNATVRIPFSAVEKGFSVTGWTDKLAGVAPEESLLAHLRKLGFAHVRLPIRLELLEASFSGAGTIERILQQIDRAVATLVRLGYSVSLDLHPGRRFQEMHKTDPERGLSILISLWSSIANRYSSISPDSIAFEVLNEPAVSEDIWSHQSAVLVSVIRRAAQQHTIILGPALFQRAEALQRLKPVSEANIIYAFHFYDPMSFTHQGQTWSPDPLRHLKDIPFPAEKGDVDNQIAELRRAGKAQSAEKLVKDFEQPWTAARILNIFSNVADWANSHKRSVMLNEFGVLSFKAPPESRSAWVHTVRQSSEQFCIPWTYWELRDGFGFADLKRNQPLLNALVGQGGGPSNPPDR